MINWWRKLFGVPTDYPEYWRSYAELFKHPAPERIVVLDCETTGLRPCEDKILSIGAVALCQNRIYIKDQFSVYVKQKMTKAESVPIHGIVGNESENLITEEEAVKQLLAYLGSSKILGHHIQFDIKMINLALKNLGLPKLKNKIQDTIDLYSQYKGVHEVMNKSLDELCEEFNIPKKDRHTALGDAFLTAQVYQRLVII